MLQVSLFLLATQVLTTGIPQTKTYYVNGRPSVTHTYHKASCTVVTLDKKGKKKFDWTYDFVLNEESYKEFRDQISYIESDLDDIDQKSTYFITATKILNSICEVYADSSEYGHSVLTVVRD